MSMMLYRGSVIRSWVTKVFTTFLTTSSGESSGKHLMPMSRWYCSLTKSTRRTSNSLMIYSSSSIEWSSSSTRQARPLRPSIGQLLLSPPTMRKSFPTPSCAVASSTSLTSPIGTPCARSLMCTIHRLSKTWCKRRLRCSLSCEQSQV